MRELRIKASTVLESAVISKLGITPGRYEYTFVSGGRADAPALHNMMAHMNVGDIVYIKSHPIDRGLIIKAVGIVIDDEIISTDLGDSCLRMNWIWVGKKELGRIPDKYNVRNNTLYVEYNPTVRKTVVNLLTSACAH